MSFLVFSEKLDVYDDTNLDYIEMDKAAKAFIGSIIGIATAFPLYKFFPTKIYRNYLGNIDRLHIIVRKIINKNYTGLKAAVETGTVDETKANG